MAAAKSKKNHPRLWLLMMALLWYRGSVVAFRGSAVATSTTRHSKILRPFLAVGSCWRNSQQFRHEYSIYSHPMSTRIRPHPSSTTLDSTHQGLPSREQDTIFALSSGGSSHFQATALAVIRISGPRALSTLQSMLIRPSRVIVPRQATLCKLYQPITSVADNATATTDNRAALDHALVLYFPNPNSFTGEDVVELHCHGSRAVVTDILDALSKLPGHRMAEPGEFTQRAFDAGKLDLMQVEALADLLTADTSRQRQQALTQLDGTLSQRYAHWRQTLISGLAHAEAVIDFGDDEALGGNDNDDDSFTNDGLMSEDTQQWSIWGNVRTQMDALRHEMEFHLQDSRRGELVREGLRIAIVGPPNAGKSSLFNVLAQKDAAIVSNIAGTTRDILELSLNLGGIKCVLSDTAGVRTSGDTVDEIEQEGIRRAKTAAQQADVVVAVMELGDEDHGTEILQTVLAERQKSSSDPNNQHNQYNAEGFNLLLDSDNVLLVLNKVDLKKTTAIVTKEAAISKLGAKVRTFEISCSTNEGIDPFLEALTQTVSKRVNGVTQNVGGSEGSLITRARHRQHVQLAVEALIRFDRLSQQGTMVVDMAAEELRLAASELGRVTGAVDVEDILDVLFKDFCIGK